MCEYTKTLIKPSTGNGNPPPKKPPTEPARKIPPVELDETDEAK